MTILIQALPHKPIILPNAAAIAGAAPLVSVFDRSFLYGDSLYEVARTDGKGILFLDEHLSRLRKSAELCLFSKASLPDFAGLKKACIAAYRDWYSAYLSANPKAKSSEIQAYLRIIYSRGSTQIGFSRSMVVSGPSVFFMIQPIAPLPPSDQLLQKGLRLKVVARHRNSTQALDPLMKSGNYLNCLLGFLEAQDEGFDDALFCNSQGHVTEGSTFSIFYIKRGIVVTSPLDIGILDGITRTHTLAVARKLGLPVREVRFDAKQLLEADEVFMTSTTKDIYPVTQVNEKNWKLKTSCLTLKLRDTLIQSYQEKKGAYTYV